MGPTLHPEYVRAWRLRRIRWVSAWVLLATSWGVLAYGWSIKEWDPAGVAVIAYFLFLAAASSLRGIFLAAYVGCFLATPIAMLINLAMTLAGIAFRVFELLLLWPFAMWLEPMMQNGGSLGLDHLDSVYRYTWAATTLAWISTWVLPARPPSTQVAWSDSEDARHAFPILPLDSVRER